MRKVILTLAAFAFVGATATIPAAPASAETVVIKKDRGHHYGWNRGHHYGWYHRHDRDEGGRVVVIKKHRHFD